MVTVQERRNDSPVVQVGPGSGKVPHSVLLLADLEYVERSIHRMMCAWGNQFLAWEDKQALSRHVWEQAEVVRRLRDRIDQFPGIKAGAPVSKRLEHLANTVLQAPTFEDAVDGIYQTLSGSLVLAYRRFFESVHAVHDAPTHEIVQEIVTIKETQRTWLRDYRRRNSHQTNPEYLQRINARLEDVRGLRETVPASDAHADPVGVNTTFRPFTPRMNPDWFVDITDDFTPVMICEFTSSLEARRMFWPIAYMRELTLAVKQLQWVYDSPYMPWEFHHDESRHLWDESRHGDSGYSRLKDFGIRIEDVGFVVIDKARPETLPYPAVPRPIPVMTPADLYEDLFSIGMVVETGYFKVKREGYGHLRDAGDFNSAEMVLYDIIDETHHVQFSKKWLATIAGHAGVDNSNVEQRAVECRAQGQVAINQKIERFKAREASFRDPLYAKYQKILQIMREQCPLIGADSLGPGMSLPM